MVVFWSVGCRYFILTSCGLLRYYASEGDDSSFKGEIDFSKHALTVEVRGCSVLAEYKSGADGAAEALPVASAAFLYMEIVL